LQKHPLQMSPRQFVPPLFILSLFVTAVAAPWLSLARWLFVADCAAYGAALSAAAAMTARRDGWHLLTRLPLVFATMHATWGTGFLLAAVRFWRRWTATEPLPPRLYMSAAGADEFAHASATK
jgi:succinoglycan biosynthesis protein ExoA